MRLLILLLLLSTMSFVVPPRVAGQVSGDTILAVFAHPDDEFTVAPVLARYAREGAVVYLAIATDGSRGVQPHAGIPPGAPLAKARADEARCAAEVLGIQPPILFGLEDGGLAEWDNLVGHCETPECEPGRLTGEILRLFHELRPDAVITWGPDGGYGHADHRLISAVTTEVFQEGGEGWPANLYYVGIPASRISDAPDWPGPPLLGVEQQLLTVQVPYADEHAEIAERALQCHGSQFTAEGMAATASIFRHVNQGRIYFRPFVHTTSTTLFASP